MTLAISCAGKSWAQSLEMGGYSVLCKTYRDTEKPILGYGLFAPRIKLINDALKIRLIYKIAKCQEINGKIDFYPIEETNKDDHILLENPHLFDVEVIFGNLDKNGLAWTEFEVALDKILSKKALRDLRNGSTVQKKVYFYYGNFKGGNANPYEASSYNLSGGYYTLTMELKSGSASILKFIQGRE
jgi:hypothetical protein